MNPATLGSIALAAAGMTKAVAAASVPPPPENETVGGEEGLQPPKSLVRVTEFTMPRFHVGS